MLSILGSASGNSAARMLSLLVLHMAAVSIARASLFSGAEEVGFAVNKVFMPFMPVTLGLKINLVIYSFRFAASPSAIVSEKLSLALVMRTQAFR